MRLMEGHIRGHADETAQAPGFDERIVLQIFKLLFGHVFKAAVRIASYLAEIGLLKALIDR